MIHFRISRAKVKNYTQNHNTRHENYPEPRLKRISLYETPEFPLWVRVYIYLRRFLFKKLENKKIIWMFINIGFSKLSDPIHKTGFPILGFIRYSVLSFGLWLTLSSIILELRAMDRRTTFSAMKMRSNKNCRTKVDTCCRGLAHGRRRGSILKKYKLKKNPRNKYIS